MARARSTCVSKDVGGTGAGVGAVAEGGLWREAPETFGGVVDPQSIGPFCIQCMSFVANVVSCSSYREEVLQKVQYSSSIAFFLWYLFFIFPEGGSTAEIPLRNYPEGNNTAVWGDDFSGRQEKSLTGNDIAGKEEPTRQRHTCFLFRFSFECRLFSRS